MSINQNSIQIIYDHISNIYNKLDSSYNILT